MEKVRERLNVTHDMILREFAKIAFSNMGNYYDERGAIKPMCCLTSEEKAAISYYQIMDSIDEHGNRVGELGKIKLHNKMSALDKIAKHVGFYEVKKTQESRAKNQEEEYVVTVTGSEAFVETYESKDDNKEEDGLMVNDNGVLVTEVAVDGALAQCCDTGSLESSSATAGKILTLSPLRREAKLENPKPEGKAYAVVSSRGNYSFRPSGS